MEQKDYYQILGVNKTDSKEVIKKAYKKLVMQYHPDKASESKKEKHEEKFKEMSEAYAVLGDDEKRKQYDNLGHSAFSSGDGNYSNQNYNFHCGDFESILRDLFGRGFSGSNDSEFFYQNRDVKFGEDLKVRLEIELEDAAFGREQDIEIRKKTQCHSCNGSGARNKDVKECEECNGKGRVIMSQRTPFGIIRQEKICETCEGEGRVSRNKCEECNGSGTNVINKKIKIRIPKGIDTNQVLKIEGEGNAIKNGQNGDLLVVIQIKPHKTFRRDDDDIYMDYSISFSQAALGTKISVPTLFGNQNVKIAAGTDSGTVLRFGKKGMPHINRYGSGDQFVTLKVETPKKLNRNMKKLFNELSTLE